MPGRAWWSVGVMVVVLTGCSAGTEAGAGPAASPGAFSPASSPATSSAASPPLAGTDWELTALLRDGVELPAERSPREVLLRFDGEGKLTGSDGCNHLGGDVRIEPGTLHVGQVSVTLMACPGYGTAKRVISVLDGTVSWAVEGTSLRLTKPDGQGLLYERKVSARPGPDVTPLRRHP